MVGVPHACMEPFPSHLEGMRVPAPMRHFWYQRVLRTTCRRHHVHARPGQAKEEGNEAGARWKQAHVHVPGPCTEALVDALSMHGAVSVAVEPHGDETKVPALYRNGKRHFAMDPTRGNVRPAGPTWNTCKVTAMFEPHVEKKHVESAFRDALDALETHGCEVQFEDVDEDGWMRKQTRSDEVHPSEQKRYEQFGSVLRIVADEQGNETKRTAQEEDVVVCIDAAMAFGSGAHPTTRLCLEWLEGNRTALQGMQVMDFGCGTGVLGIAALKLGAKQLHAIDIEEDAVRATMANAERNGCLDHRLVAELGKEDGEDEANDPTTHHGKELYDLIMANVLLPPLLENREKLTRCMKPGGMICMSGILAEQAPELVKAYAEGFHDFVTHADPEGKWVRVVGVRKGP